MLLFSVYPIHIGVAGMVLDATYMTLHFILIMTLYSRHYCCDSKDEILRTQINLPVVTQL